MTRALIGILGALILISGWGVPAPADAQQEVRAVAFNTGVYSCPELRCYVQNYPQNTPLFINGTTEGEQTQGSTTWYSFRHSVTWETLYIPAGATREGNFQPWMLRLVTPGVSARAREIYARGIARGNNPNVFAKVGDCQNVNPFFLAAFDNGDYNLGGYVHLSETITRFSGSFGRDSAAVDNGFNVASVLSSRWADRSVCEGGETPLACEQRRSNPSIALISMETWWTGAPASEYEAYLSSIVEYWIDQGVVPIVATKADNLEGDHSINAAIVRVADRYGIPLWNFWLAVQHLPNHGLDADRFHLNRFARSYFNDPQRMQSAWAVRNLTALMVLHSVARGVS